MSGAQVERYGDAVLVTLAPSGTRLLLHRRHAHALGAALVQVCTAGPDLLDELAASLGGGAGE